MTTPDAHPDATTEGRDDLVDGGPTQADEPSPEAVAASSQEAAEAALTTSAREEQPG